jgi:hypothetical protein
MAKFTYLTNVNIDNLWDAIGIFKSELQADFYSLKKKEHI